MKQALEYPPALRALMAASATSSTAAACQHSRRLTWGISKAMMGEVGRFFIS